MSQPPFRSGEQERLLLSSERLLAMIDKSRDVLALLDTEMKILYISPSVERLLGYTSEEYRNIENRFDLVHPDEREQSRAFFLSVLDNPDKRLTRMHRIRHKNGAYRWIEATVSNLLHDPAIAGILTNFHDITEQKEAEEVLQNYKERLELAQTAGEVGIFEWDIKRNVSLWNRQMEELHGLAPGMFGETCEHWAALVHPEDREQVENDLQEALQTGLYVSEGRVIYPDGSIHWLQGRGKVFFDPQSQPERMIGAAIDITQRKQLEQQKDEFLAMVSHELKTPVTSLLGFTELLQPYFQKTGDERSVQYLAKMEVQIHKLTNLINDLLDITKMDAEGLQLTWSRFSLDELLVEIVNGIQQISRKHRIVIEGEVKQQVYADRERIGQVLTNLLTNAIKYSPLAEKVVVRVSSHAHHVTVSVQDFGLGIAKEDQVHIFERFYRVSGRVQKTIAGIGLGLYISSEIIRRHKGTIWVESEEGTGSTFSFSLFGRPAGMRQEENKAL